MLLEQVWGVLGVVKWMLGVLGGCVPVKLKSMIRFFLN